MPSPVSPKSDYGTLGLIDSPVLVDVRSEEQRAAQPRVIPGALCIQPQDVQAWAQTLPYSSGVVVY